MQKFGTDGSRDSGLKSRNPKVDCLSMKVWGEALEAAQTSENVSTVSL